MRLLVIGCFALWVAAVAAQAPRTLTDHPATQAPATGRSDASTLTEKLRPSSGAPSTGAPSTKKIENTPLGRAFHYIEPFATRQMIRSQEITPLFA